MLSRHDGLLAYNGTRIETPQSIEARMPMFTQEQIRNFMNRAAEDYRKEVGVVTAVEREIAASYSTPIMGNQPNGLGYTFGDTWRRTQKGTLEFNLPITQTDVINMSLRFAFENAFIGKAMKLKTDFTCKGTQNSGQNEDANNFFNNVTKNLYLHKCYRQAVWLYYTVGMVPILMPEKDEDLNYVQILDPRMVRVVQAYGKTKLFLVPDPRMLEAVRDKDGNANPLNKAYYDAMPKSWRKQIEKFLKDQKVKLLELEDGSYIYIENRNNPFDRMPGTFDGAPLQPYFGAAEQYRMLMAGDFAAAFLAKNLIALVSVGDPKAEGADLYMRPDDATLLNLQASFQNPSSAMWAYVDPTTMIRYITPEKDVFDNVKYAECKEILKNLLPSPLWYNAGQGAYAQASLELQWLQEEVDNCNLQFDSEFWQPLFERAARNSSTKIRLSKKDIKPPKHEKNSLRDDATWYEAHNNLYNNGAISVRSYLEAHGKDPDQETQRLRDQMPDAKKGVFMPAFESKQGIVAQKTYGIKPKSATASTKKAAGTKGGRPSKTTSRPNPEKGKSRTPRPSES